MKTALAVLIVLFWLWFTKFAWFDELNRLYRKHLREGDSERQATWVPVFSVGCFWILVSAALAFVLFRWILGTS